MKAGFGAGLFVIETDAVVEAANSHLIAGQMTHPAARGRHEKALLIHAHGKIAAAAPYQSMLGDFATSIHESVQGRFGYLAHAVPPIKSRIKLDPGIIRANLLAVYNSAIENNRTNSNAFSTKASIFSRDGPPFHDCQNCLTTMSPGR
jgi:hypothetical protein